MEEKPKCDENTGFFDVNIEELRDAIVSEYEEVANKPQKGFHFHTGRPLTKILGYDEEWLEGVPESTIESFAGTGNPFSLGLLKEGEQVIDIGCGAGIDSFIAAGQVGAKGKVTGVDMTEAMLNKAKASAKEAGITNIEFMSGHAERLPAEDGTIDVVISNGVINLIPDKNAIFREIARVLKPGGRIQIGDIIVQRSVPDISKRIVDLWTGWIAGALLEEELGYVVRNAGFDGFEVTWRRDVFKDAPYESSAANFGTVGINYRAYKK